MKHPKLWDGISSVLVLFGLGLYGKQLLLWHLGTDICSTGVHRAGRGHCRAHTALPVLPSLPRHDVFHRQKDVLPALRQRRARGQKCLTAPSFSAMLDASCM